ncbi:MAG: penicillin-binding protein 2, partial [Deltaproteobacteria bacterium]|nr:penicillin-binding protein 2 [Deltaproteobacteria bacterium]
MAPDNAFNAYDSEDIKTRMTYRTIFVIMVVLISVIVVRLWYLQIYLGSRLEYYSQNNHLKKLDIIAPRGNLYDRRGELLASNSVSYSLYITPPEFRGTEAEKLSDITGMSPADIKSRLSSWDGFSYTPILVDPYLSWEQVSQILANKPFLPGVSVRWQTRRYYVSGEDMSHVLGYVREISGEELASIDKKYPERYVSGDFIGKYGIEKTYENDLRGRDGAIIKLVDASGKEIKTYTSIDPAQGESMSLTIDAVLQSYTADLMKGYVGCAVAMDPSTGAILAMVSVPSFDINDLSSYITPAQWKDVIDNPDHPLENKCIQGTFAPGSTYKPVLAIAGLNERVITPEKTIVDPGYFVLGNRVYHDWKKGGHGIVDMHKAIVQSCDTYFYKLGTLLGVDTIAKYAGLLGFGKLTGIDLPSEKPGLVPTSVWKEQTFHEPWYPGETPSISIGQGYDLVTPLQLLVAYSAIANGGSIMKPHVMLYPTATTRDYTVSRLGISEKILDVVRKGLLGVVNEPGGTAPGARLKDIQVAGKTGTAQVVKESIFKNMPESRIPMRYRDNAWFVAFAPYSSPRIAVVVLVEHGGHGGFASSPIAKDMIDFYLRGDRPQ